MSELMSALDGLAAEDLTCAHRPAEAGPHHVPGQLPCKRLAGRLARTVRSADVTQSGEDDGMATMQSWLRGHCRLSRARGRPEWCTAAGHWTSCRRSRPGSPTGAITAEQVTVAARVARPEHMTAAAAQDVDLAPIERRWPRWR